MKALRLFNQAELKVRDLPFSNFHQLLNHQSDNSNPFIRFYDQGDLQSSLTFSEFFDRVKNFSLQIMQSFSPAPDDKIVVAMDNSPETLIAYSAVMWLGLELIPVDPNQTAEYFNKISMQFNTVFLIASDGHPSESAFTKTLSYKFNPAVKITELPAPRSSAVIFTSSGTTGLPKGIVQSFEAILINTLATVKVHELNSSSTHFAILPVFHVNAFSFSFFTSLYNGNELILNRGFHLPRFWETVKSTRPSIISLIPPVLRVLAEDPRDHDIPAELKYVVSAASNLGKKTLLQFYKKYSLRVIQAYGLSETVNFTATFPVNFSGEDYERILAMDNKTSIGTEVYGNNIFLLNEENLEIDAELTEGELAVRGWNVFREYYQNEAATAEAFKSDYFHTGDIGYFRIIGGKKFFYLSGRKKEVAKVNGRLVFLNEIDELLLQISDFENVCSVCYLDHNQEEQMGVYLLLNRARDLSEIKAEIKNYLPKDLNVKKIIIGSDILMTASGKKRRSDMARTYFNEAESP